MENEGIPSNFIKKFNRKTEIKIPIQRRQSTCYIN